MLVAGSPVLVCGLVSKPAYNGRHGQLEGQDADGRWRVRLSGPGNVGIRVQPGNLCLANDEQSRARFLAQRVLDQDVFLARLLARHFDGDVALSQKVASCLEPKEALLAVGCTGSGVSEVVQYGPKGCQWHSQGLMAERFSAAVCTLPNDRGVLVAGGVYDRLEPNTPTVTVEAWDVLTGLSHPLPCLNGARYCAAAARIDDHVYVCGGGYAEFKYMTARVENALAMRHAGVALDPEDQELVSRQMEAPGSQSFGCASTVERLSLRCITNPGEDGAWELVRAPSEVALVCSPAAGVLDGKLVVAGGESEYGAVADCWSYCSADDSWEKLPMLPAARAMFGFGMHPHLGLVLAGGKDAAGMYLSSVIALRLGEGWRELAPLNASRYACTLAVVNGSLFVLGGVHCPKDSFVTSTVERYSVQKNRWEVVSDMTCPSSKWQDLYAFSVPRARVC